MKLLPALLAGLLCSCATAIHERPNPVGGPPLTSFWTSSNADEIDLTTASGAKFTARRMDNSTGPKEAVKTWGMIGLGRKAIDVAGDLGDQAIDTFGGGE
jgi:hypothetical protein